VRLDWAHVTIASMEPRDRSRIGFRESFVVAGEAGDDSAWDFQFFLFEPGGEPELLKIDLNDFGRRAFVSSPRARY
jgi:hypothetical protein